MADNKVDMQIGLGVEYDATGFSAANADIDRLQQKLDSVKMPAAATQGGGNAAAQAAQVQEQLAEATQTATEATEQQATATAQVDAQLAKEASTLWELAEAKNGSASADAKEQKAMQLATKSRNELIKTLQQLQKELKAAAEAQDVEKYRAVEQEIAETRSAFEKQNQVLELNNIQLGQQAQNGMMVASSLSGMAKGMQEGTISAGDFVSGILSISAAMKAGLGPIGWLMMAVQGLQAAWDFFSAEDKEEAAVRAKRAEDMQRLAEITDNARKALEDYNSTELSKKALVAVQGYYANINRELERQIKNIDRATQAELARLAITQNEEEHKRTMQRAKLGRQLAAGTITQEEYDRAIYDMNEAATKQGLDADVATAEAELKDAEAKVAKAEEALNAMRGKLGSINRTRNKFGPDLTADKLTNLKDSRQKLGEEMENARKGMHDNGDKDDYYWKQSLAEVDAVNQQIIAAYDKVHGAGAFATAGLDFESAVDELLKLRKNLDEQHKTAQDAINTHRNNSASLYETAADARTKLKTTQNARTRETQQLAEARVEAEKDRELQKLIAEKQQAETEVLKLETAELSRRQTELQKRADAAKAAGDAEGAHVLSAHAAIYMNEHARREFSDTVNAALPPNASPRSADDIMQEATGLANSMGNSLQGNGRTAEQLLDLLAQAKATQDKRDDELLLRLLSLVQQQSGISQSMMARIDHAQRQINQLQHHTFD